MSVKLGIIGQLKNGELNRTLTWTNAVEITTPVPNCFNITKTMLFCDIRVREVARMGVKTPIALVTRMTKSSPIRRVTLYSRSVWLHVASSGPPTQCLGVHEKTS